MVGFQPLSCSIPTPEFQGLCSTFVHWPVSFGSSFLTFMQLESCASTCAPPVPAPQSPVRWDLRQVASEVPGEGKRPTAAVGQGLREGGCRALSCSVELCRALGSAFVVFNPGDTTGRQEQGFCLSLWRRPQMQTLATPQERNI